MSATPEILQTKIIVDWTYTYICKARLWVDTWESKWQITKIDADWSSYYPQNWTRVSADFEFSANDYATYFYSHSM
jgi:hypothetical protein